MLKRSCVKDSKLSRPSLSRCGVAASGLIALLASAGLAQDVPVAFVNARVIPVDGPEIERGHVIIHKGKITAVGEGSPMRWIESGTLKEVERTVIDCEGKVVMPGLVDTHSHVGGIGAADASGPIQPGVRVADSINPRTSGFRRVVAGGLTTINVMPGSGHLSSGRTIYLKMRLKGPSGDQDGARTIDDISYFDENGKPMGGLKMANGTNPQRDSGGSFPGTRGRAAFLVREQFIKAQEYQSKIDSATGEDGSIDASKAPPRDLNLETLAAVMRGEIVVHHHTHRHDDIITVLKLAEEFGFKVVLHHVSDAWMVADEIAAAGAPVSAILVDAPGGKLEAVGLRFETAGILEKAGVRTAMHTDDWITDSRLFLRMAAFAVRGGMSREGALESVTLAGAEMLDLDHRVGSLTVGKDADVIVLDGDPLSAYSRVVQTWVEGIEVFNFDNEQDKLYALGGEGAANDSQPYFCCYDHMMSGTQNAGGAQ